MFEEVAAYEYREQRKSRNGSGGAEQQPGIKPGFEEDFSFGEDDDSDYADRPDIKEIWPFD